MKSPNGQAYILKDRPQALAGYPHMRRAGGLFFVSGVSARQPDDTVSGVGVGEDGGTILDIRAQTQAVIANLRSILWAGGADLEHLVNLTTYLVDMDHYAGYNEIYNKFFTAERGPARTTVAVHQLPGPHLLIEMAAIAIDPSRPL